MNDLVTRKSNDLHVMTTEELRSELARAIRVTAETLVYLAAIWEELERRGEDLSSLRSGVSAYLPMIASGRADPAAVVAYAGQPTLLRAITQMPLEEQARLAAGGDVPLVILDENGNRATKNIAPVMLSAAEVRRVFAPGAIRSPQEQARILEAQQTRRRPPKRLSPSIAALSGFDPPQLRDDARQTSFLLNESEHEALKIAAAKLNISVRDMVRRILISTLEI